MRPTYEGTALYQFGGTSIASGGTITGTGIDWSPYFEPDFRMVVVTGATPSGTLTCAVQQSNTSGSGYTDVTGGTITTVGTTGGTAVYQVAGTLTQRYVRLNGTTAGGTVLASGAIIAKPRTNTQ